VGPTKLESGSIQFIRSDKAVENAFVESFNGKFRDECLNEHWFSDRADARSTIETWRHDYNEVRPHSSLDNIAQRNPQQPWNSQPRWADSGDRSGRLGLPKATACALTGRPIH
jgi:transposase InsO family protein